MVAFVRWQFLDGLVGCQQPDIKTLSTLTDLGATGKRQMGPFLDLGLRGMNRHEGTIRILL